MAGIDRKSSIESEPRTLNIDQLQFARDAAMNVMNTRSNEEALSIFTEGLAPVGSVVKQNGNTMVHSDEEEVDYSINQLQLRRGSKDVATAPF
ncbi:hypothetical protein L1049_019481 [Liquidambar formosana]|uniref:Uncharacterized protein n=1 Tax=Liquidambar formosana TaxID=63359 RepID=A0AAP0X995_LIQFO